MQKKWHTLLCMSIFFCNFAALNDLTHGIGDNE